MGMTRSHIPPTSFIGIDRFKRFLDNAYPETFGFLFASAIYGVLLFRIFYSLYLPDENLKSDDFLLYVFGWSILLPLGIAFGCFYEYLRQKYFKEFTSYYPLVVFLNFSLLLYILHPHLLHPRTSPVLIVHFLLVQLGGICLLKSVVPGNHGWGRNIDRILYFLVLLMFVIWLISVSPGRFLVIINWQFSNYLFFAVIYSVFHWGIPRGCQSAPPHVPAGTRWRNPLADERLFDVFALLLIVYLIVDPHFKYDRYHYSYYLGPLADLRAGKSLLVNINAQYGIMVFYFLNLLFHFLPLGFTSFSLVNSALYVLQYALFYFIARRLFHSVILSYFVLAALLLINFFATQDFAVYFPSTGPLRFGFIYLLLTSILLRNLHPARRTAFIILESALVSTAFLWGFEVCIYTIPPYLGLMLYESLSFQGDSIRFDFKGLLKRSMMIMGFIVLFMACLYSDVYSRTHELPHWSYYFNYISLYKNGFAMVSTPSRGFGWVIIGILYSSLFSVLGAFLGARKNRPLPEYFNVIVLLTLYGIFQFFYYLGRSVDNNLYFISMPNILLSVYWLYYLRRFDPPSVPFVIRKFVFGLAVILIGIQLQGTFPRAVQKIEKQTQPLAVMFKRIGMAFQDMPRDDRFAKQAKEVVEKYSGNKKYLAYFFGASGLEFSMYTGKTQIYPYNDVAQADICEPTVNRILSFDPHFNIGDYIYSRNIVSSSPAVDKDNNSGIPVVTGRKTNLEIQLFQLIMKKYKLNLVEITDGGIVVFKIVGFISK